MPGCSAATYPLSITRAATSSAYSHIRQHHGPYEWELAVEGLGWYVVSLPSIAVGSRVNWRNQRSGEGVWGNGSRWRLQAKGASDRVKCLLTVVDGVAGNGGWDRPMLGVGWSGKRD